MKKSIIVLLASIVAFVLFVIYWFVPISKSISHSEYIDKMSLDDNGVATIYFLKYAMGATGVNWYVCDSSDKSMIGEQAMVKTFIDPRFLSINKNYDLDKTGIFIVEASKKEKTVFEGQSVWHLYPKKTYIYLPDKSEEPANYYFRHLSFSGYIKMLGGIFYSPWRYSY